MKRKFLYCVGLLFMLAFFAPSTVYASSMEEDTEYTETYDYDISNYVVDVKVNEDNSMDITEKLEVYFNVPKHGIYRKLPIVNQIVRQDGSTAKNRAKVSDVTVKGHEFTTSTAGDYYEIKIGSENKTVTDYQNYTIKYHYDIGRDTGDGFDELYFNLIGTEWDTTIQCVEFSIEMPKKFDEEKLGFSVGSAGSTDSEDVYYCYNNNAFVNQSSLSNFYYLEKDQVIYLEVSYASVKIGVEVAEIEIKDITLGQNILTNLERNESCYYHGFHKRFRQNGSCSFYFKRIWCNC